MPPPVGLSPSSSAALNQVELYLETPNINFFWLQFEHATITSDSIDLDAIESVLCMGARPPRIANAPSLHCLWNLRERVVSSISMLILHSTDEAFRYVHTVDETNETSPQQLSPACRFPSPHT